MANVVRVLKGSRLSMVLVLLILLLTSLAISCTDSAPNGVSSDTHFRVVEGVVEVDGSIRLDDDSLCAYSGLDVAGGKWNLTVGKRYVFVIEVNEGCLARGVIEIIE